MTAFKESLMNVTVLQYRLEEMPIDSLFKAGNKELNLYRVGKYTVTVAYDKCMSNWPKLPKTLRDILCKLVKYIVPTKSVICQPLEFS